MLKQFYAKTRSLKSILSVLFFLSISAGYAQHDIALSHSASTGKTGIPSLRGNGLCFTPNKGQIADMDGKPCQDVLYKGDGGGANIYLRKTGISYVYSNMGGVMHDAEEEVEELIKAGRITELEEKKKKDELVEKQNIKVHRVDMDFEGGNQDINVITADEVDGYRNFYYAHCPQGISGVKQYNKVTCKNIYNNIDVSYYGDKQNGIKYDIIVQPYTDPNQIKLHWKGAESIHINQEGNLVIKTSVNEFTESIPKVYQYINGKFIDVKVKYILKEVQGAKSQVQSNASTHLVPNTSYLISFNVGTYNSSFPLIIDPWATYYGGSDTEYNTGIATDPWGNVVISGQTYSIDFPIFVGAGYSQPLRSSDAYAVKFNAAGTPLWSTYYGGTNAEKASGIATDNSGNIVITGITTSVDFPFSGGFQAANGTLVVGESDAFVVKFNAAGMRLWSTYYGGKDDDIASGIATDNAGNIAITGYTNSSNFPVLAAGGYSQGIGAGWPKFDAFVVKFDATGTRLWATYYGGSNDENTNSGLSKLYYSGICIDNTGNILITGNTKSGNFPVLAAGGYSQAFAGSGSFAGDMFVVKFNSAGVLLWATLYGGSSDDMGSAITTDNAANIIVTGSTTSANFPALAGYQMAHSSSFLDAFVVKFNSAGARQWATLYGAPGLMLGTMAFALATDVTNNIYIFMEVEDGAGPTLVDACSYQPVFNGGSATNIPGYHSDVEDQMILKFTPSGQKSCATYLGGTGEDDLDSGGGIAIYGNSLYLTGSTDGGYPVTAGAFQTLYAGPTYSHAPIGEGFVVSLCTNICEGKTLGLNYTASATSVCANVPVTFTPSITNACDTTGYKFKWTFTGASPSSSAAVNPVVTFPGAGSYSVKLVLTTACKKDSVTKNSYITVNNCGCILSASAAVTSNVDCSGASNGSATVTISNGSGGPYTYNWSNGASSITTSLTSQISNLAANTYTVTATVTNGTCVTISTVTITQALSASSITSVNPSCFGANNGSATVTVSAPVGSYTYNWSNGASSITTSLTSQISNLSPNTYTVTVTGGGCSITSTVTLTQSQPLIMGTATQWSCLANKGTASIYPAGGNTPYAYLWNNTQTTQTVSGLTAGNYTITLTDASTCSISQVIALTEPTIVMTTTQNDISCFTNSFASFSTVVGGINPYAYTWSTGKTGSSANWSTGQEGDNIQIFTAGVYTLTLTDAGGCSTTRTFTINGTSTVVGTFSFPSTVCVGTSMSFTNTGTPPASDVTYSWYLYNLPGSSPFYLVSGATTTNLSYTFSVPGLYQIYHAVRKPGCVSSSSDYIKVINCSAPSVTATGSYVCPGACGTATSSPTGGTSPYVYSWSTGETSQNINPCTASTTTYTVKITDAGGTTATATAIVTINPAVTVTSTPIIGCAVNTGSATANPSGGTPAFSYVWSNSQTAQTATGLATGNYIVTVTDSKGCTASSSTIIGTPMAAQYIKGTANCTSCGCKEWIIITAANGTQPYSYSWPGGYDKRYKNHLCPGSYTVTIKDKNGCSVNINLTAP
jgi:PKD repeat protein